MDEVKDAKGMVSIPVREYRELAELHGRVKAFDRYIKEQRYANVDVALAILGLEPLEKTDEGA